MESIISLVTNKLVTTILLLALALLAKKYRLLLREVLRERFLRETKKGLLLRLTFVQQYAHARQLLFIAAAKSAESLLITTHAHERVSDFMTTIEPAATFKKSCLSFAATAVSLVRRTVILTKKNTCK